MDSRKQDSKMEWQIISYWEKCHRCFKNLNFQRIVESIKHLNPNRIPTELLPPAAFAVGSQPDAVELFGSVFYEVFVAA